jgi:HEAT repeat protein
MRRVCKESARLILMIVLVLVGRATAIAASDGKGINAQEPSQQAISKTSKSESVESLIAALTHEDGEVRNSAAKALGRIGDTRAVEPLSAALKDKYYSVRTSAAEALGKIGDTRAIEPLIAALKDDVEWVRRSAAEALGMIGDMRAFKPLLASLKDNLVREKVEEALVKIGLPTVEPLITVLKKQDNDRFVRSGAARVLGRIGDTRAVEPLIAALKDEDDDVRGSAAGALGMIGDTRAVEILIESLNNDDSINNNAAWALGKLGDPRAVESLIDALQNQSDKFLRREAAEALGNIGDSRAVEKLIGKMNYDNDLDVRRNAVDALGKIGDPRAVRPLIVVLTHYDRNIRSKAAEALEKLGWQAKDEKEKVAYLIAKEDWNECVKMGKPAVKPLAGLLWGSHSSVCINSAAALGSIGDPCAVEPLVLALNRDERNVRSQVIQTLAMIGDKRALPGLVTALKDWHSGREAAKALQVLGWQPESISDKVHYAVAVRDKSVLIETWEQTKSVLLEDVSSYERRVIENALYAFVALGKKEIILDLVNALNSKGNKTMAEAFLNCGHGELRSAARAWAKKHGYTIRAGGGAAPVRWGSLQ